MSVATDQLSAQISWVREEIHELEATLPNWDTWAKANRAGSKEARAIMGRIVASVENLKELVRQHSFG
jgi:formylglycine-generating enzyme required for sulfatase activity